jgi:hypothetical protein
MNPLITNPQRTQLLANGAATARGVQLDPMPVVKLFTPDAQATWLLTELDADGDRAYGLCDLGVGMPELGYVSISELESLRGPLGLPIERDTHFVAKHPLSEYAVRAHTEGAIRT